jgi:hypothetical protein
MNPRVVGPRLGEENYAVDDAENPLQLLARASDISDPPQRSYTSNMGNAPSHMSLQSIGHDQGLQSFFGPFRSTLDIAEDLDPIAMGLVTVEESEMLFA